MTDDEKIKLVFQNTNEISNIDYINELLIRLKKGKLHKPKRSSEKGFEDYWVVYDTNLLSNNDRIACIRTNIETNQIVIALHDFFDFLPLNVRQFILYHEVGHIINNHIIYDDDECMRYKEERKVYLEKGVVHPDEVLCDKYAVSRVGKENAVLALNFLIDNLNNSKELVLRRVIIASM